MQAGFSVEYSNSAQQQQAWNQGMNAEVQFSGNVQPAMSVNVNAGIGATSMTVTGANVNVAGGVGAAGMTVTGGNVGLYAADQALAGNVTINAGMPSVNVAAADFSIEFQGYGKMTPKTGQTLPPPPPPPLPTGEPPEMKFSSAATLTEADARQALYNYANSNACFGTDCPKEMTVTKIIPSSALEYVLETFCESRETKMDDKPYKGGNVDGPFNGPPPPPWSIPCVPDSLFHDHKKEIEVPHTSTVRSCHDCHGHGYLRCTSCNGRGKVECTICHGDGKRDVFDDGGGMRREPCFSCGGDGTNRCGTCSGDGRITCHDCDGYGQIRTFVELKVKYKNHKSTFIMESTDMPDHLVSSVPGTTIFEQTLPQVWPIISYPVMEINVNSQKLVNEHRVSFPGELQLHQRHTLRAVPVTEVHYSWKETRTRFWVYGTNRSVYAPDYPQQGCCVIL